MLLSHTSGQEYDWLNPLLGKWRESRNEQPWTGETVEQKSTVPLVFEPGTSFAYGGGLDWAGKMIEKATEKTLEEFMAEKIWRPLGINDITFYPWRRADMKYRMATFSTLSETDEGPAEDKSEYDILMGGTDCLGGGGAFASAEGYFVFLQAVLRRDARILTDESWTELFKPQLDAKCKRALNGYLCSTPAHTQFLGMHVPPSIVKNWSFAGLICEEGQEGRMRKGSIFWGGVPCMQFVSSNPSYLQSLHMVLIRNDSIWISKPVSVGLWQSKCYHPCHDR
jgi:CubicO group peptidase (beta-lactamase class C family)